MCFDAYGQQRRTNTRGKVPRDKRVLGNKVAPVQDALTKKICSVVGDQPHAKTICAVSVSAGEVFAEQFAPQTGEYLACLDGYSQGIVDGYLDGFETMPRNEAARLIENARRNFASVVPTSAVARGRQMLGSTPEIEADSQVIGNYKSAVRNNQTVRNYPNVPNFSQIYQAKSDITEGYFHDLVLGQLKDASGRVAYGELRGFEGFSNARLNHLNPYGKIALFYMENDRTTRWGSFEPCLPRRGAFFKLVSGLPRMSMVDFFTAKYSLDFSRYDYTDKGIVRKIFLQKVAQGEVNPRLKSAIGTYVGIDRLKKNVKVTNADGTLSETKVDLSDAEKQSLRTIFISILGNSYDAYSDPIISRTVRNNFTNFYNEALWYSYPMGNWAAEHNENAKVYDRRYIAVAQNTFTQEGIVRFNNQFDDMSDFFKKNSVLEFTSGLTLVGESNDGIFSSGEGLFGRINIANYGERSTSASLNISGRTLEQGNAWSVSLPALSNSTFNSNGVFASILGSASPRTNVQVNLGLRNNFSNQVVMQSLNVQEGKTVEVHEQIESTRHEASVINLFQGQVIGKIKVSNPSTLTNSAMPIVSMSVLGETKSYNLQKLQGRTTKDVEFRFAFDPLAMINGSSTFTAFFNVGLDTGRVYDKVSSNVSIPGSRATNIIRYLSEILSNRTNNFGVDASYQRRVEKLKVIILDYLAQDIGLKGSAPIGWGSDYKDSFLYLLNEEIERYPGAKQGIFQQVYKDIAIRAACLTTGGDKNYPTKRFYNRLADLSEGAFNRKMDSRKYWLNNTTDCR
jgi:hypothetical protein